MNIKLRATVEVTAGIVGVVVVVVGIRSLLNAAVDAYGIQEVLNGIAFGAVSVAAYVAASLLYDMRVAQLQYKEKLQETTKKG